MPSRRNNYNNKPYARPFSSKKYKSKYYVEQEEDEDADFKHDFYFSPPSRLVIKIKPFQDKPVANFSKGNQFLSLSLREFYDLVPIIPEMDEWMKKCKQSIAENIRRKMRRGPGGSSGVEADYEQIPISDRSKKEADDLARMVDEAKCDSGEESDG